MKIKVRDTPIYLPLYWVLGWSGLASYLPSPPNQDEIFLTSDCTNPHLTDDFNPHSTHSSGANRVSRQFGSSSGAVGDSFVGDSSVGDAADSGSCVTLLGVGTREDEGEDEGMRESGVDVGVGVGVRAREKFSSVARVEDGVEDGVESDVYSRTSAYSRCCPVLAQY